MVGSKFVIVTILAFCVYVHDCSLFKKQTQRHSHILERLKSRSNSKNQQIDPAKYARERCVDQNKSDELCLTEDCIHLSSRILAKIDRNTNPCQDFYKFSCGKWQESNAHKIDDQHLYYASNLNEMPEEVDNVLKGLISKRIKIYDGFYDSRPYKDLKYYHKSCLNTEKIQKEGFAPAAALLKTLKKFFMGRPFDESSFDVTEAVLELLTYNGTPLFEVSIDTQFQNSSKWGLVVSTPRHYGLIKKNLIGPTFRKRRKPGIQEIFRSKGRKILTKILKEMQNDLFFLELLTKIKKGKRTKVKEIFDSDFQEVSDLKTKFSKWDTRSKSRLSFYAKVIEKGSENKINEDNKDNKKNTDSNFYTNLNKMNDDLNFNNSKDHKDSSTQNAFQNEKQFNDSTPPQGIIYINSDNITDIKHFLTFLDSSMIADINETFYSHATEDANVLENITTFMIPSIISNIQNIDDDNLMSILNMLMNDTNEDEQFFVIGQDIEAQKEALEMIQMLGMIPPISRKDLYEEIQKEVKSVRSKKLSDDLRLPEFKELLVLPAIAISENVAPSTYGNDSEEHMEAKILDKILSFVNELREFEPSEREDILLIQSGKVYNPLTIKEMEEKFSFINWRYLLNTLANATLPDDEIVQVYYLDYMTKSMELLSKSEPWLIHHGMLLLYVTDVLNELVFLDSEENREEFCFSVVKETMTDVMSHMYLHHNGPHKLQELKDEILPMTQSTTREAIEIILQNSWMTSSDKVIAINKLKKMDWQIGSSDKHLDIGYVEESHKDIEIKDRHFLENTLSLYKVFRKTLYGFLGEEVDEQQLIWSFTAQPYTINAFHLQSTNSIVMPEAFFRPPYYNPGAPSYFNYGSAGMAFAHEMVHALDSTGSLFDAEGSITSPFSSNLLENLENKIDCFHDMVQSTFHEIALVEGLNVDMEIDNNATMNENIADISGLHFSYNTYLKQLKTMNSETTLPGLDFTKEQLFFIGFAQPYCAILPSLAKVILMEIDEHLPHDIRVNSLMMNSPDFAKVFNCKAGDRMFNDQTCPIF